MKKDRRDSHGVQVHGERRQIPRRQDNDRRGGMRWDPGRKERRSGRDRRKEWE